MTEFLVFRLYGPLAAWGTEAVGELRPAQAHPSRSAILGLVGACLGLDRADDEGQQALASGYGVAVRVDSAGVPLRDYHTVQMPKSRRGFHPHSRRDALAAPRENLPTMQTWRDYRQDAMALAALWPRPGARWPLADLAAAMTRPRFMPYLGRKSCPLALPPAPEVMSAETVAEAFGRVDDPGDLLSGFHRDPRVGFFWDEDLPGDPPHPDPVRTVRRDQPVSRRRWQFEPRTECTGAIEKEGAQCTSAASK